jgi:SAM-dependent methyltransferase
VTLKQLLKPIVFWSPIPCICCGIHMRPRHREVIWDALADEWELTTELRGLVDEREGSHCTGCGINWRVRQLARVLLDDVGAHTGNHYRTVTEMVRDPAAHRLQIAEVNELPALHKALSALPGLIYTEYGGNNSQDLMALTYPDNSFDYLLTSDTLEHVPDFDRALREIHRVLRPCGKQIFTIPLISERATRQRAELIDGHVVHHLPPSHHGTLKVPPNDYLVFNEFGGDVIGRIEKAGFAVRLRTDRRNPLVVTIAAQKGS